jgi:hypothetical protein
MVVCNFVSPFREAKFCDVPSYFLQFTVCRRLKKLQNTGLRVDYIQESSPYRKENTALHRYKDQPVNGCLRK